MATTTSLHLSQDPDADALLTKDPLALLLGMLLDQQIPMEKAFKGPHVLQERLGSLDAKAIAGVEDIAAVFAQVPAIHRYPASMARRVQKLCQVIDIEYGGDATRIWNGAADGELCRHLVEEYDGDAERIWKGVTSGDELLARLEALPGFGNQKARIFVALLGKQRGVRPKGWREAAGSYGEAGVFQSVADVRSPATLLKVRAHKQSVKAAAKAARST